MSVWYQGSEREEAARQKLYEHVCELRESLLDLLNMVSASNDPAPAIGDIHRSEVELLRHRARAIELRDLKINRARRVIDGTKEAEKLAGKQ